MNKEINNKFISIGFFNKTHGLNGELKAFLYNEESEILIPGIKIWLDNNNSFDSFKLLNIRGSKKNIIIKLEGFDCINQCMNLIKKKIYILRSDFPIVEEGYYFADLIGFSVLDNKNNSLGALGDIIYMNNKQLFVVNYLEKEVLIPNEKEFVELFEFDNKVIILKNIDQFFK